MLEKHWVQGEKISSVIKIRGRVSGKYLEQALYKGNYMSLYLGQIEFCARKNLL